ncbi:unnamed protein product [Gadus morhua 'NCC']
MDGHTAGLAMPCQRVATGSDSLPSFAEVRKAIAGLKNTRAAGLDGVFLSPFLQTSMNDMPGPHRLMAPLALWQAYSAKGFQNREPHTIRPKQLCVQGSLVFPTAVLVGTWNAYQRHFRKP